MCVFRFAMALLVSSVVCLGQTWLPLSPTGTLPPPVEGAASAYNSLNHRFITFGGYIRNPPAGTPVPHRGYPNAIWVLTNAHGIGPAAWINTVPEAASGAPSGRYRPGLGYDHVNNRMIMFGGYSDSTSYANDVWILTNADGTGSVQPQWSRLITQGVLPAGRWYPGTAYDQATNRLMIVGGLGLNDAWVLTNANGLEAAPSTWIRLSPTGTPPPGRDRHVFAYDATTNRAIIYGGATGGGALLTDTWVLQNANGVGGAPVWQQLSVAGTSPQRQDGNGAFDPATNRLIAYGGDRLHFPASIDDAWILSNANGTATPSTWSKLTTSGPQPFPRAGATTAYDTALNRLIVFGGEGANTMNDTWVLANASGAGGGPLKIDQVLPSRGGSAGSVTMRVLGAGFQPGATIKLTGVGADIVGTNTSVLNPSTIINTFFLAGVTAGIRSVVVTNPGGASFTSLNAFRVEQGGAPQVRVDITGFDRIRIGQEQTYYLRVANIGSVDSPPGIVWIRVPSPLLYRQLSGTDLFAAQRSPNPLFGVSTDNTVKSVTASSTIATASDSTLMFATAGVPAGSSQTAVVPLTVPFDVSSTQFTVTAAWNPDLLLLSFDDYATSQGFAYIPFQSTCSDCYTQAVAQAYAATDAAAAFTTYQNAKRAVDTERTLLFVSIGGAVAQVLLLPTLGTSLGLSVEAKALLDTFVSVSTSCAKSLTTGSDCLLNVLSIAGSARTKVLAEQTELNKGALRGVLASFNDALSVLGQYGTFKDALGNERATEGTFQQRFQQYKIARATYQECLTAYCGGTPPFPPPSELPGTTSLTLGAGGAFDPNDKFGRGKAPAGYIDGVTDLPYSILFENLPAATAPAQRVFISDQLDATQVDLSTFALGPISFGAKLMVPPPFTSSYTSDVDLRPENNLIVRITTELNMISGLFTVKFVSLDPATGQPPTDPLAGFLPPNRTSPEGQGSILFTIVPKPSLTTGSQIRNKASIVFDANPAIITPEWLNTIDAASPTSRVLALAPTQANQNFTVQWSGTDVGAGIGTYTIYVSDNNGPFTPWLTQTVATRAPFNGLSGHTYTFYSIARDLVGNVENAKTMAEATTRIVMDTTPPVITPTVTGTLGANGWYRSNATVSWNLIDPESGIASSTACGPTTLTTNTDGTSLTCSATNGGGLPNSASVIIKIDKTLPNITCSANPIMLWPPNGKAVRVTVSGTGSDATSGIDASSLTYAVTDEYGQVQPKGSGGFAANGSYSFGLSLVADRKGNDQDGRKYTTGVSGKDRAGNVGSCSVVVTVPHDQGRQ